ncbi:MAG TPA: Ig-like domain repeat protein [Solirubrobacteraceae bacterium]|nr:Ig-like domain repeat protein [Solirubrobacteraceae bacterium]
MTGRIYWANLGNNTISYANLDGSGAGGELDTLGATLSRPEGPALLVAPSGTGAPTVTGAPVVGSTLGCSGATWAVDVPEASFYQAPENLSYSWTLNGVSIPGATASALTASSPGNYACQATATNHAGSATQTSTTYAVHLLTTTTLLAASPNPSPAGEQVTYTATVSPAPDGGTVTFTADGLPIPGCEALGLDATTGVSTWQMTYGAAGTHYIQAYFSGDAAFAASQSSVLSQTVNSSPGGAVTGNAKPSCTLTSRNATRNGELSVSVRCNQPASILLTGRITVTSQAKAGKRDQPKKTTLVKLASRHTSVTQGKTANLTVKLPKSALDALRAGARETAALTLSVSNKNGTSHTSTTIKPLELATR